MTRENDQEPQGASPPNETTGLLAAPSAGTLTQRHEAMLPRDVNYGGTSEVASSCNGSDTESILKPNNNGVEEAAEQHEDVDKPLPMSQVLLLCLARMVDPVSFFCIFPFVNQMIYEMGEVDQADVGFYSGLIESLFSVCQMLTMLAWGRASDHFGRRPVLIGSLTCSAVAVSLFGFSQNIAQMIAFRCLAGIFSGTVVTIRAMITEVSTKRTQARAFSFFAFSSNIGIFLGPIIGGGLSKLAEHYPGVFGGNKFLRSYPYALPTLVSGGFAALCAVVVALFVKETLNKDEVDKHGRRVEPMSTWELVKCEGVVFVLYIYGAVSMLGFGYTAVAPVFWFEPVDKGGFGFDERLISLFLSISGVSQALWLLFIFPPVQHRIGTGGVLRLCTRAYPFFFLFNPVLNWFLKEGWRAAFWAVGPVIMVVGSGVAMNFTAVQLALNDVSPSPNTLGTLNALALTIMSAIRAFSPALFTSLYAVGVRLQILWGQFIWAIIIALVLVLAISLHWLPKQVEDMPAKNNVEGNNEVEQRASERIDRREGQD